MYYVTFLAGCTHSVRAKNYLIEICACFISLQSDSYEQEAQSKCLLSAATTEDDWLESSQMGMGTIGIILRKESNYPIRNYLPNVDILFLCACLFFSFHIYHMNYVCK